MVDRGKDVEEASMGSKARAAYTIHTDGWGEWKHAVE